MLISPRLLKRFWSFDPDFIVHVGAHLAEEAAPYEAQGWGRKGVVWIEADPNRCRECEQIVAHYPAHIVINAVLSDRDESVDWYPAENGQSSSILKPSGHLAEYPDISFSQPVTRRSKRFDSLGVQFPEHSSVLVNLDIQGAELLALKGFGTYLENVRWIYSEVSLTSLYDGGALIDELDRFLFSLGFVRVDISITAHGWGDAVYVASSAVPSGLLVRRIVRKTVSLVGKYFAAVRARL